MSKPKQDAQMKDSSYKLPNRELKFRVWGRFRKNNPGMNDNGIRWLLWRRRDWKPVQPDPYECSCHKLHKTSCPNAIARRLSEKTPESPSNSPDPTSGPSPHPTGDNAPESK